VNVSGGCKFDTYGGWRSDSRQRGLAAGWDRRSRPVISIAVRLHERRRDVRTGDADATQALLEMEQIAGVGPLVALRRPGRFDQGHAIQPHARQYAGDLGPWHLQRGTDLPRGRARSTKGHDRAFDGGTFGAVGARVSRRPIGQRRAIARG
jgi:hypothetical protein